MRLITILLIIFAVFVAVHVYAAPVGGDPYPPRQDNVAGVVQHGGHSPS